MSKDAGRGGDWQRGSSARSRITRSGCRERLFLQVFKTMLQASGRDHMADIPPSDVKRLALEAVRQVAPEFGFGLKAAVHAGGALWSDPLGVLTTDHVGYVSFDLRRLRPDVQVMLAEASGIAARTPTPRRASRSGSIRTDSRAASTRCRRRGSPSTRSSRALRRPGTR
jgi:hypothetical protein